MEEEITIKVTDPKKGDFVIRTKKQSEMAEVERKVKERGHILEIISPEKATSEVITPTRKEILKRYGQETSSQESFLGGLLSGLTLSGKEEIQGILGDEKQQRRAELQSAAQQKESPISYGIGKFLGGLAPMGAAALGGAKIGGAVGGPWGALIGGGIGAGLAGMGESAFSRTMEERKREGLITKGDVAMGVLSGLTEGAGKLVAPYVTGITRKLFDKIATKAPSNLTSLEKAFIKEVDELGKLKINLKHEIGLQMKLAEKELLKATGAREAKQAAQDAAVQEAREAALKAAAMDTLDDAGIDALNNYVQMYGKITKVPESVAEKASKTAIEAIKKAQKENISRINFLETKIDKMRNDLLSSIGYSGISAAGPSALATIPESEMTPEQKKEFQQYLAQEALRELQQRKKITSQERKRFEREMSIRRPPM